jgi:hypothetical protein
MNFQFTDEQEKFRQDVRGFLEYEIKQSDLANLANISLEDALREKEAFNAGRKWGRRTQASADHS